MMRKILLMLFLFANMAQAKFSEIDERALIQLIKEEVVVIDVRRNDEFKKYGIIKGAKTLTFFDKKEDYDIQSWLGEFMKIIKSKEDPVVLYCAHANRTKIIGNFLSKELGYKKVYDLKGGINYGWIDKGLKTVIYKPVKGD